MLIFHSPRSIELESTSYVSGSTVRPQRMLAAFRSLGLPVFLVDGSSTERAQKWREVLNMDPNGITGVYSELSTMPIALADPDHRPRHPFHDFNIFNHLRKKGVPIAAFYRDVYWRFPHYAKAVPAHKRLPALAFYHLEAWQLSQYVDHIFLPSMRMRDYIPCIRTKAGVSALPPGGVVQKHRQRARSGPLRLFYVGGVGGSQYDISTMLRAVNAVDGVRLTLCCREAEWRVVHEKYPSLRNVDIVHHSGAELEQHYRSADAFIMWRTMDEYLKFSMPVKLGEAVGWGLPVITNADCEMGDVVLRDDIGWTPETEQDLAALLTRLCDNKGEVTAMQSRVVECRQQHSWEARAETVISTLDQYRGNKG